MERNVHLSDKDVRQIRQYLTYASELMLLSDWTLTINEASTEDEDETAAWAQVACIPGRRHAKITFCAKWSTGPGNHVRRHVLVHELAHLHFAPMKDHMNEMLWDGGYIPSATGSTFSGIIGNDEEYIVDKIADAFAPTMKPFPLPKDSPMSPRIRLLGKGS